MRDVAADLDGLRCDRRRTFLTAVAAAFSLGLAAHAFRYFNFMVTHDSVMIHQSDAAWQISLGRFLQPVYLLLRGELCAPFLIGLLSLVYIALAGFVVIRMLRLRSRWAMVLACGVLAANTTVTLTNATYFPWADINMAALLLGVCAVWLFQRYRYGFLPGAVLVTLSVALYQSYFQAAIILLMIVLVARLLDGEKYQRVLLAGLKGLAMLLIGLGLYYCAFRSVLYLTGISAFDGYNGIANVLDFSSVPFVRLLCETYLYGIRYFVGPIAVRPLLMTAVNALLFVGAAGGLVLLMIRRRLSAGAILVTCAVVALMPLGMNAVYFLSKGTFHELMVYSFFFLYVFALMIFDRCADSLPQAGKRGSGRLLLIVGCVLVSTVLTDSIIYANQAYMSRQLVYEESAAVMTRVLDRIEQTDGYVPGETPVALIGELNSSPLFAERDGFEQISSIGVGMGYRAVLTYSDTVRWYFEQVLGYPIRILEGEELATLASLPEVAAMPAFPAADSCRVIDGTVVVRLAP